MATEEQKRAANRLRVHAEKLMLLSHELETLAPDKNRLDQLMIAIENSATDLELISKSLSGYING